VSWLRIWPAVLAIATACSSPGAGGDPTSGSDDDSAGDTSDPNATSTGGDPLGATSMLPGDIPPTDSATATDSGLPPSTSATATSGPVDTDSGPVDDDSSTGGAPVEPPPPATYQVTIHNTWSQTSHPGAVPDLAHFSWLAGTTHDASLQLWDVGQMASPGMVQMAETGITTILVQEILDAMDNGQAAQVLSWHQWFCPAVTNVPDCGAPVVQMEIAADFPLVTLVTMLGPSPDLFVGVEGLSLLQDGQWVDEVVIDLLPYDGGTRSDVDFTMNGALQLPPEPISAVDSFEDHILGPASLGTMRFVRLDPSP
jgi:hypothetical protein